jgi:hypothetical protein
MGKSIESILTKLDISYLSKGLFKINPTDNYITSAIKVVVVFLAITYQLAI